MNFIKDICKIVTMTLMILLPIRSAVCLVYSFCGGLLSLTNKQLCRLIILISCCLSIVVFENSAFAWARHNLLTVASIQEVAWLSRFERITVSPYQYQDDSLNPECKIIYTNPKPEHRIITPSKFVYYDLSAQIKYGFQGVGLGEKTNALQILIDFSDEPDWGMDKNLELAFRQKFMGGSQGYRHMYYPAGTWHLPQPFFSQGKAPQRAVHFYQLARQAFEKEDTYWGFRFLARTMHYIQDLAQPYHTTQLAWAFFHVTSPLDGTTQTTKNYHFGYESLVARILELEAAGRLPSDYQRILKEAPALSANSVEELAVKIARKSQRLSEETFAVSIQLMGDKLFSRQPVPLTDSDVETILAHPRRLEFDRQVKAALKLIAAGSKGLLELARQEFSLKERIK